MITATQPKEQGSPSAGSYKIIAIVFFALAASIAIFSIQVVFAKAEVIVLSEQEETEAELIIDIAQETAEGEVSGGVYEISKKASQTFPATSIVNIEMKAEGRVKITSTLSRSQTLLETTRLVTPDDIMFRTEKTVVVPAFGSVEVDIYADEPGSVGEIGDATFTIPGLNPNTRRHFTVETVEPLIGGQREVTMVTASDIMKANELLGARLEGELEGMMRQKAHEDDVPTSGELFEFEVERQETDVMAGEEADEFTLTVAMRGSGVFFEREQLRERVREMLEDRLSYDRALTRVSEDKFGMRIEKCDLLSNRANIRVSAKGTAVLSADSAGLNSDKLTGVTIDAATEYLESLDGVSSASVKVKPFWARRLPDVAENIRVDVR
jgi:hypothetical protein